MQGCPEDETDQCLRLLSVLSRNNCQTLTELSIPASKVNHRQNRLDSGERDLFRFAVSWRPRSIHRSGLHPQPRCAASSMSSEDSQFESMAVQQRLLGSGGKVVLPVVSLESLRLCSNH